MVARGLAVALAVLAAAAPAARATAPPVPILLYHHLSPPPAGAGHPRLWVRRSLFAAQVRELAAAGYHAVTLDRAWRAWHGGARLPPRPVVFSFDDGYPSQASVAAPVLRARGWSGVLNLGLRWLDAPGGISSADVRRLVAGGWEVDSHSLTHPDLRALDPEQLRRELVDSRAQIRARFGVPARFFCYPYGRSDPAVRAAVRRAGYVGATTIHPGYASPQRPFLLDRILVDGRRPARDLLRRLSAAAR